MKKINILIFIFSMLFLVSCGKEEQIENTTNTNSGQNLQSEIKTETENKEITNIGSGKIEITNTGIIQEKIIEKELIKEKNGNIYLFENGIKKEALTTKASNCIDPPECMKSINYDIIQPKGKYGIVYKREQFGECGTTSFYGYSFSINEEILTKIDELGFCFLDFTGKINGNFLNISINTPEYIVDNVENKGEISKIDIISAGFKKQGNDYVKTIDLKNIIEPKIKKEEKVEVKKIKESKLDSKYSDENLKKNGYKLNNLGNIKEYYKEDLIPEKVDADGMLISRGYSSWKTIYIEGNKVLDFEINYDGGQNLIIGNDVIDLTQFEGSPIQAIFGGNGPKIIISDLDTIKIVDKENSINKIIWSR